MRNFQKQQLLEIMESLHLLHQEMKERLGRKEYPTVQAAFSDCQEAAIQIGEAIEQMEGEGTEAVTYLEQYCEKVYHLSLQMESIQAQKLYKTLESSLIKAENAISHISVRKEVVFLPYKASMWDSLESVYLAAREDEKCDAYVVPIPYYDKNPDGSFREMHYEGGQYPDYVSITNYENFDFEIHHPDVIYIHNPYDEWNNVTCVPEKYFSKNLCHYTDCLVYIPYFILNEIKEDDKKAVEGMRHFCFLPGTIYSHKVIVQSENMCQIYINEYIKEAKQLGFSVNRKNLEEKILGLGSPKIDKVQNTRKEDLDVPEEWLKVIRKPDGSFKKIILYNTSVGALLKREGKMLRKMEDVFRIVKESREEVVLLWRPHPLIKATIEAMRPQLRETYTRLLAQYRKEVWGLYDDTADMNRAIALSDAYYGDASSIVQLYRMTGKPVMLQNCSAIGNSIWNWFDGGTYYNGNLWCINRRDNSLYAVNAETAEIEYVDSLSNGKDTKRLYLRTFSYQNMIYLIPCYGKSLVSYNVETREVREYECKGLDDRSHKFYSIAAFGNYIYAFPIFADCILKFDIQQKEVTCLDKMLISETKLNEYQKTGYFIKRNIIYENWVIVPCAYTNKILVMNMETQEFIWKVLETVRGGFVDIELVDGVVYLLDREMCIYRTDIAFAGKIEKVHQLNEKYGYIFICNGQAVMIPEYNSRISVLDLKELSVKYVEYPADYLVAKDAIENKQIIFSNIAVYKNEIFLISSWSNMLVKIYRDTTEIDFIRWNITERTKILLRKINEERVRSEGVIYEDDGMLSVFLDEVIGKTDRISTDKATKQYGKIIYDECVVK